MAHSVIVGGSTASRVIHCPGSVRLCSKMPPRPSSEYADEGTLLHDVISEVLSKEVDFPIGRKYNDIVLTEELVSEKLEPALGLFDQVDPAFEMKFQVESRVDFGDLLPGVFGSADLIGRLGNTAIVLDWKFGSGVPVPAEENYQLMFYACAARRTESTKWAFDGADEIELIIIQPPSIKRWKTTFERLDQFEQELVAAVKAAGADDAPLKSGTHCRWCAAKPVCPVLTGAVDRARKVALDNLPASQIADYLTIAPLLEQWVKDLRALAAEMLENDKPVPGWKLVAGRATRSWSDAKAAEQFLRDNNINPFDEPKLLSPAKAETALKKSKVALPNDLIVSVSSSSTLAPESDPRPAVLNVGKQLTKALEKLV